LNFAGANVIAWRALSGLLSRSCCGNPGLRSASLRFTPGYHSAALWAFFAFRRLFKLTSRTTYDIAFKMA
jgi:hypothetical protein